MGNYTLTDFLDETRLGCGGIPTSSTTWTVTRLTRYINDSYLWCSMPNHYKHPELEIIEEILLAANTAVYVPTNTYYHFEGIAHAEEAPGSVVDTTRRTRLSPSEIQEQMSINRTASKPAKWAYWQLGIRLNCVPSTTYAGQTLEVYGYHQPTLLSGTAATVLKGEWDEIVLEGAKWRLWNRMEEYDRAYECKQNYGQLVMEVADIHRLGGGRWGWSAENGAWPGPMGEG